MNRPTTKPDSAPAIDVVVNEDLARRPCGSSSPANDTLKVPCEPKRTIRCDHAQRELYRNHFPVDR